VLEEECERAKIPYTSIPVATIKREATGKGNADKDAMVAAARARWPGFEPATDDEADARFLALAAARELEPTKKGTP
jgi:Holliday junction resolvasome RuvABC endonuclease subunit